jgi:hypothetical protein
MHSFFSFLNRIQKTGVGRARGEFDSAFPTLEHHSSNRPKVIQKYTIFAPVEERFIPQLVVVWEG